VAARATLFSEVKAERSAASPAKRHSDGTTPRWDALVAVCQMEVGAADDKCNCDPFGLTQLQIMDESRPGPPTGMVARVYERK